MEFTLKSVALCIVATFWAFVIGFGLVILAVQTDVYGRWGFIQTAPVALLPVLLTLITIVLCYSSRDSFEPRLHIYGRMGIALLLVLGLFAYWVWPTPWRYFEPDANYRQNRFTGTYQSHGNNDSSKWVYEPNYGKITGCWQ